MVLYKYFIVRYLLKKSHERDNKKTYLLFCLKLKNLAENKLKYYISFFYQSKPVIAKDKWIQYTV